jgi:hypothetical protein
MLLQPIVRQPNIPIDEEAAWQASAFTLGCIPELPPPKQWSE